jgi:hypothetical protein
MTQYFIGGAATKSAASAFTTCASGRLNKQINGVMPGKMRLTANSFLSLEHECDPHDAKAEAW